VASCLDENVTWLVADDPEVGCHSRGDVVRILRRRVDRVPPLETLELVDLGEDVLVGLPTHEPWDHPEFYQRVHVRDGVIVAIKDYGSREVAVAAPGVGRAPVRWVTRERPKTDRIACPWLIRRFIDPGAEILYVPADEVLKVAEEPDTHSFDADGAEYTHRGNQCSFEVLIDEFDLGGDPALVRLARIVHAADVSEDLDSDPAGAGLLAIGIGGLLAEPDDQRLLDRGMFVYDALYEYCRQQTA
jgi:hypothetical protein